MVGDMESAPKKRGRPPTPEGFVNVTLPSEYGAVYVRGPDGREVEYKGGSKALVPLRQAKSLGLQPTGSVEPESGEASVEDASIQG